MAARLNRFGGSWGLVGVAAAVALGTVTSALAGCDEPPKEKAPGAPAKDTKTTDAQKDAKDGTKGDAKKAGENVTYEKVTIAGKEFKLELALTDQKRFRGLSGREEIPADGGMLFVFTQPKATHFVMRDCPIPIDIIFLDPTGRVTATHKMVPDEPRGPDEKKLTVPYPGAPDWTAVNEKYEDRLKKYPSRYDAQFVIELAGNTLDSLKIKEGDQIKLDVAGLKKRAE